MFEEKDSYCWVCYEQGNQVYCSKCGTGFHLHCVEGGLDDMCDFESNQEEIFWIKKCLECQEISKSRILYSGKGAGGSIYHVKFKKMPESLLNLTMKNIFTNGALIPPITELLKTLSKNNIGRDLEKIINIINSKLDKNAYSCSEEFLFDIKKIRYVIRSRYTTIGAEKIDSYIERMVKICQEMDLCPFCVYNYICKSKGVIELCPWGHKLVLVDFTQGIHFKLGKYNDMKRLENLPPVFPAKVLRFDQKTNILTLRHFGSLMSIKAPRTNVYMLRTADLVRLRGLSNTLSDIDQKQLEDALTKASLHLVKLRSVYGKSFPLATQIRNWVTNDGYFITRGVDMSESKIVGRPWIDRPSESDAEKLKYIRDEKQGNKMDSLDSENQQKINKRARVDYSSSIESLSCDGSESEINETFSQTSSEMITCTPDFIIDNPHFISQVSFSPDDDNATITESSRETKSPHVASNGQFDAIKKSQREAESLGGTSPKEPIRESSKDSEPSNGIGSSENTEVDQVEEEINDISLNESTDNIVKDPEPARGEDIPRNSRGSNRESQVISNQDSLEMKSEAIRTINHAKDDEKRAPVFIDLTEDGEEVVVEDSHQLTHPDDVAEDMVIDLTEDGDEEPSEASGMKDFRCPVIVHALDLTKKNISLTIHKHDSSQTDDKSIIHDVSPSENQIEAMDLSMK